jgi:hypothetical protein
MSTAPTSKRGMAQLKMKRNTLMAQTIMSFQLATAPRAHIGTVGVAGYLSRYHDGNPLDTIKLIFIGGLLVWIVIGAIYYALTGVILSIEFGATIRYRCALGERRLPWHDVARIIDDDQGQGKARLSVTLLGIDGSRLTFKASAGEYRQILTLSNTRLSQTEGNGIMFTWWTCIGLIAIGTIVLAIAGYIDYLQFTGAWMKYVSEPHVRVKILMTLLPWLAPVAGISFTSFGIIHLRRHLRKAS